ncbi:CHASE3 domain-containing protein [Hymenobacter sp. 15J16-1T3B]|uniref:sensor histidine kinase n=1 Tax=Hymenobacter sp. 15J16-1T3B TaxID=2886941 RepID=UPI001D114791|nr:ATP-binding protein [Hymenobacter sp. 15J16-1T3B]MCC3158896.1 CHASE3 domain-containing protein [Hymenobacter sp. 15J16-1T3B]
MALQTKTKLYIGFAIAAGVLLLTAVAAFISIQQLSRRTNRVEHSYRVMQQLKNVELRLKDARSGVRGFLLTRDTTYLRSYEAAREGGQTEFELAKQLVLDNPEQNLRLDTLNTMISAEMRLFGELVGTTVGSTNAVIQTGLDTDRQSMRAIERLLARARKTELALLSERSADQEMYESLTPAVILLSAAVAVVVTLWLFWRVGIEIGANERLRTELAATNESVAQRIGIIERLAEQVVQGDYKVKIRDREQDSLGNLATSLNRMTQTLDEAFGALEKRNRELDQFAYVASHDLKAPLRGVSTVVKWIEDELGHELSPKMQEYFGMMKGRLVRLEDLINGLLAYARVGRTQQKLEDVNVERLVHDVADLVVPPTFELRLPDALPTLVTDRLSLQQVFTNLLSNAVKYHHTGLGIITVGCRERETEYEFRVQDDGPGIAPEYHEKIFLMFQTLRDRHTAESTGIGLSIVKKIIDEQHGSIRVESAPGQGAAFIFTWPKGAALPAA